MVPRCTELSGLGGGRGFWRRRGFRAEVLAGAGSGPPRSQPRVSAVPGDGRTGPAPGPGVRTSGSGRGCSSSPGRQRHARPPRRARRDRRRGGSPGNSLYCPRPTRRTCAEPPPPSGTGSAGSAPLPSGARGGNRFRRSDSRLLAFLRKLEREHEPRETDGLAFSVALTHPKCKPWALSQQELSFRPRVLTVIRKLNCI